MKDDDLRPKLGATGWVLNAFFDLDTERQLGMSAGPIPFMSIVTYAERYGLGEDFVSVIQSLDSYYLKEGQGGTG